MELQLAATRLVDHLATKVCQESEFRFRPHEIEQDANRRGLAVSSSLRNLTMMVPEGGVDISHTF